MKNKKHFRIFAVLISAILCLCGFTTTTYASGSEDYGKTEPTEWIETQLIIYDDNIDHADDISDEDYTDPDQTEPAETNIDPQPLTPEGNMSLMDDISGDAAGDKQFIVVQSRSGNYFYIIIDNAAEGENTVHFLNQIDEADLMAIIDDGSETTTTAPAVCTCTDKCEIGMVNTMCTVCSTNLNACIGVSSKQEPEETEPPAEKESSGKNGLIIFLVVGLIAGGGAFYYFKILNPKKDVKGDTDIEDFDFDDYDEDEDMENEEQEDDEDV